MLSRDPARITHTLADMIRARIFAISCGYEDADDLDFLRADPALLFKLALFAGDRRGLETGDISGQIEGLAKPQLEMQGRSCDHV